MKEVLFITGFLLWYVLAIILTDRLAKKGRLKEEWAFFICFVFSPLAGLILLLIPRKRSTSA